MSEEDRNKQLVVWNGPACPRPIRLGNQTRLVLRRPNKMLKWLLNEYTGLRKFDWVPQSSRTKSELGRGSRKLILSYEEGSTEARDEDGRVDWLKKTYTRSPRRKSPSLMLELEDVDREVGLSEQNSNWLEIREEVIFNFNDIEEEVSEDPISSEEEKEGSYEFDKDEESNIWMASAFKEAGEMGDRKKSQNTTNREVTIETPTEVNINSLYNLQGSKVHDSDFYSNHPSFFHSIITDSPSNYSPPIILSSSLGSGNTEIDQNSSSIYSGKSVVSRDSPKSNTCIKKSVHEDEKGGLGNHGLQLISYSEPNAPNNLIIEHQNDLQRSSFGDCTNPKSDLKIAFDIGRLVGLSEEECKKFNALLSHMGMSLVPTKKKSKIRKTREKSSSRKGVRELKNLKCEINYEKERGASYKNRVVVSNK